MKKINFKIVSFLAMLFLLLIVTGCTTSEYKNELTEPKYTVPTVESIIYDPDRVLKDIVLPDGWTWDDQNLIPSVDKSNYSATYTPQDTSKYSKVTKDIIINVNPAEPHYVVPNAKYETFKDGFKLSDIYLENGWNWSDGDILLTVGENVYKAIYSPKDRINYKQVEVEVNVTIHKAIPEYVIPTIDPITYSPNKSLKDITLPSGWSWLNEDSILLAGINAYTAIFIPNDMINYKEVEIDLEVTISKATPECIIPTFNDPIEYKEGLMLSDIILPSGWSWVQAQALLSTGQLTHKAIFTPVDENYDSLLIDISFEVVDYRPTIKTGLTNEYTYANKRLTFDVWAKDYNGKKINSNDVSVTINGVDANVNWDDSTKTSYTIDFIDYENIIEITATVNNLTTSLKLIVYYVQGPSTVTISIDAFTIGCGYVIEPMEVKIDDAFFEGLINVLNVDTDLEGMKGIFNGAYLLAYIIKQNGYELEYTGRFNSSFYLEQIVGFEHHFYAPDNLIQKLEENNFEIYYDDDEYLGDVLGEFAYTQGSGWMYSVNGVFPNVGFADYYPQDGDVIRVQFTLVYGVDINGGSSMGWDYAEDYFELVDRDLLTKLLGYINKNNLLVDNRDLYNEAVEVISTIGVQKTAIDDIYERLYNEVFGD